MEGEEGEAPSLLQPPPSKPEQASEGDVEVAAAETLASKPKSPVPVERKSPPTDFNPEATSEKGQMPASPPPMPSATNTGDGGASRDDPDVPRQNPFAEPGSPDEKDPNAAETASSPSRTAPVHPSEIANGSDEQFEDSEVLPETLPEEHDSDQERDVYAVEPLHTVESEEEEAEAEAEARRLMSLAEESYRSSDLKSALKHAKRAHRLYPGLNGLAQMLAALRVLRAPPSDHYRALRVEPFSHASSIRRQYKALALLLHPDKSQPGPLSTSACEEAFKRVGQAFRILSDRNARRDYDLGLRMELQRSRENGKGSTGAKATAVDSFWTACDACGLLHQFDRRYIGHRLLCPSCRKSFRAVEVEAEQRDGDEVGKRAADSAPSPVRARFRTETPPSAPVAPTKSRSNSRPRIPAKSWGAETNGKRKTSSPAPSPNSSPDTSPPRKRRPKEQTLAEMQLEALRMLKSKRVLSSPKVKGKEKEAKKAMVVTENQLEAVDVSRPVVMAVEDSDFYDFDKDRVEKSFQNGQVWAIYDDDDGMPRHYGHIDEIQSTNPFNLRMCWLDLQSSGEKSLLMWEQKTGYHISCGRFKVGKKIDIDSVNMFSHVVDCDRVAREVYRIYPKKGSVWALYSESTIHRGEERHYDIVVSLTSYTETHGVSVGYLKKVEGFKTVFKRHEIGAHAVKWMKKGDFRMFSHQIPVRKLSGSEAPDLPEDCWELDPASLPAELLHTTWKG